MPNYDNRGGGRNNNYRGNVQTNRNKPAYEELTDENYVDLAEKIIKALIVDSEKQIVTTSQIRNLLAMTADIYNDVNNSGKEALGSDIVGRINYLKVRMIYESGRTPAVKMFVEYANLIKHIDSIKNKKERYIRFSRYMEALVAYRKYLGGKDD